MLSPRQNGNGRHFRVVRHTATLSAQERNARIDELVADFAELVAHVKAMEATTGRLARYTDGSIARLNEIEHALAARPRSFMARLRWLFRG